MTVIQRSWTNDLPRDVGERHTAWQKSLVDRTYVLISDDEAAIRRIEEQQALLKAANSSSLELASVMREGLRIGDSPLDGIPLLTTRIESDELRHPHYVWEKTLHDAILGAEIGRSDAAQPVFWTLCTIRWLESGFFPDPPAETLRAEFDIGVLNSDPLSLSASQRKVLDGAEGRRGNVRNLLRETGGIPHVRDRTGSNIQDCSLTAAWWRCELVEVIAPYLVSLSKQEIHQILSIPGVWRVLANLATTQNVLLAEKSIAGLIAVLSKRKNSDEQAGNGWATLNESQVKELTHRLGRRTVNLSLHVLEIQQIAELCEE